jgi:hypothetical protein
MQVCALPSPLPPSTHPTHPTHNPPPPLPRGGQEPATLQAVAAAATDGLSVAQRGVLHFVMGLLLAGGGAGAGAGGSDSDKTMREDELVQALADLCPAAFGAWSPTMGPVVETRGSGSVHSSTVPRERRWCRRRGGRGGGRRRGGRCGWRCRRRGRSGGRRRVAHWPRDPLRGAGLLAATAARHLRPPQVSAPSRSPIPLLCDAVVHLNPPPPPPHRAPGT